MQDNNKMTLKSVGQTLIAALIGFAVGYFVVWFIPNDIGDASFYAVPIALFLFTLAYLMHILIHEFGHLVFGLLSGYSFVSFRVGNLTLIRKDGKFKFASMNIPGTGGQCLMSPPSYNDGYYPYVLYNLGGVLINLITSVIALFFVSEDKSLYTNLVLTAFSMGGFLAMMTNVLPMKVGGIPTDGYNIRSISRDKDMKYAFWLQLKANALFSKGIRPKDLPYFEKPRVYNEEKLVEPLITSAYLLEFNYLLDRREFALAKEHLNGLLPLIDELIPLYQTTLKIERLFLELIDENDPEVIDCYYDEDLTNYIQLTENWLDRKRFYMAYEWFYKNNAKAAMENYHALQELAKTHPNEGEVEMELELAEWVKRHIQTEY